MKITPHTKISELIKANSQSVEAIASLSKTFEKLKNPFLRKILAPRVTITEATKIGGCTLSDFKRVLEPLGFSLLLVENEGLMHNRAEAPVSRPAWLRDKVSHVTLNVRKTIEDGHDPLKEIVQAYHQLPAGQILCIVNSFIPYPLLKLLENKGAKTFVATVTEQEYHSYFLKDKPSEMSSTGHQISAIGLSELQATLDSYDDDDIIRLDVRELPMPQPMETILHALASLRQGQILYIRHKRVPLHLLEEMEEYRHAVCLCEVAEGDIRLLIHLPQ